MKKRARMLSIAAAGLLVLLLLFSFEAKLAATRALQVCIQTLIPTLFPFYCAANLLVFAGLPPAGKRTDAAIQRLFGLPGTAAPALLLGLLAGYPVGASVTASLYRQGVLSREEAVSLSRFANNAGPGFVIGAAGLAVFQSAKVGIILYVIHAFSAVLTGFLLRNGGRPQKSVSVPKTEKSAARLLPDAVFASVKSMAMICAYVILFSVLLAVIKAISPVGRLLSLLCVRFPAAEALLCGILELSNGILLLSGVPAAAALVTASVLLSWGGLCVYFQTTSVLSEAGLPSRPYLRAKAVQAVIAAALCCLYCAFSVRSLHFLSGFGVFSLFLLCILKIRGRKIKKCLL